MSAEQQLEVCRIRETHATARVLIVTIGVVFSVVTIALCVAWSS